VKIIRESLVCLLLAVLICFFGAGVRLEITASESLKSTTIKVTGMAETVTGEVASVDAIFKDAVKRTDARTGQALAIVSKIKVDLPQLLDRHAGNLEMILDSQLGTANANLNGQLSAANSTVREQLREVNSTIALNAAPIGDFAKRYTIPDREVQGLVAETIGVLGATKVTLGQAAKASLTFDQKFPKLMDDADHISSDITREADALTKPQSFMSQMRTWILFGGRVFGAVY
jgi:hypothetical protein